MQLNHLIKALIIICAITCFSNSTSKLYAQANTWTKKADFSGMGTIAATGFSIGTKGYIGTGGDGNFAYKSFWEYDPATNVWTQKADFGGIGRTVASRFSIGSKGYIGTGYDPNAGFGYSLKDFWEYNPETNIWTQKADFGGMARNGAAGFSIGTKGYIGIGYNSGTGVYFNDFWEYDPGTDSWTQKAAFPGTARENATGFAIGSKGYIGTGINFNLTNGLKDFWEYDPGTDMWTQKADFGGIGRYSATGFSIGSKGYIGTGRDGGFFGGFNYRDFWEYDQMTDTWLQKADFGGVARYLASGFSIGTKGYIGTGFSAVYLQDFWEYSSNAVLPVSLLSFTGKRVLRVNELNWQTADEINVSYYLTERSRDGVNFSGFNDNRTTANNQLSGSYSITDYFPFNNISFYRLKIVDNDGRFKYSKIIAVKEEIGNSLFVFPNPARDILFVQLSGDNKDANIEVIDAMGRKLKEEKVNGNASVSIDIKDIPRGIYTLLLKKHLITETRQFIRQ